jgi:glutaredoxin
MLMRRLDREKIEYEYVSLVDETNLNKELYIKYGVKSTPCLLVLDNDSVSDTLKSTDEIVEFLKNV